MTIVIIAFNFLCVCCETFDFYNQTNTKTFEYLLWYWTWPFSYFDNVYILSLHGSSSYRANMWQNVYIIYKYMRKDICCEVLSLCASRALHWPVTELWQCCNSFNMALQSSTAIIRILTNLCATSRWRVSCRCVGKTTDHQRPWSEAACRPLSPPHEQTGKTQRRAMK